MQQQTDNNKTKPPLFQHQQNNRTSEIQDTCLNSEDMLDNFDQVYQVCLDNESKALKFFEKQKNSNVIKNLSFLFENAQQNDKAFDLLKAQQCNCKKCLAKKFNHTESSLSSKLQEEKNQVINEQKARPKIIQQSTSRNFFKCKNTNKSLEKWSILENKSHLYLQNQYHQNQKVTNFSIENKSTVNLINKDKRNPFRNSNKSINLIENQTISLKQPQKKKSMGSIDAQLSRGKENIKPTTHIQQSNNQNNLKNLFRKLVVPKKPNNNKVIFKQNKINLGILPKLSQQSISLPKSQNTIKNLSLEQKQIRYNNQFKQKKFTKIL